MQRQERGHRIALLRHRELADESQPVARVQLDVGPGRGQLDAAADLDTRPGGSGVAQKILQQ
ncbi:hypothetical protein GCM10022256_08000 [Frondihabitans peucedani]|uniref:Uncharacterized protein n=1 Tax=Frondihabitans peucedani TaxID=598626 RepID=A0ABP8DZ02_9MICO